MTVNPKGLKAYETSNNCVSIITSNENNVIPIDIKSNDRRNVIFKATTKYESSKGYGKSFW